MADGRINGRISDLEKTVARIERKLNHLETVINAQRQEPIETEAKQGQSLDKQ